MRRREFFKAFGTIFGASIGTAVAAPTMHIQGNADADLIVKIRAEIAEMQKESMRQLQRDLGSMSRGWNDRYGK